jgi:hypothetical protein
MNNNGFRYATQPDVTHSVRGSGTNMSPWLTKKLFYGILFVLLVPGVLVTIPRTGGLVAAIVHAIVYLTVASFLKPYVLGPCRCIGYCTCGC